MAEWRRGLLVAAVITAGLAGIVGSGGGISVGFPPCPNDICGPAPAPQPVASVRPSHQTAQVGSVATYSAVASNLDGPLSYQWRRSSDGGVTYRDIAGATSASLTLPAVNLADDATLLQVIVRSATASASGQALLAVSASPGVRYEDGGFEPAAWSVLTDAGQPAFTAIDEALPGGGNPGAYRRMAYTIPAGSGTARRSYARAGAVYDPAVLGPIRHIDYAEDCLAVTPSDTTYSEGGLVIEQGTRRYVWHDATLCTSASWTAGLGRGTLLAKDFALVAGPACGAGERCPDFSAGALPLRFGHRRIAYGAAGNTIAHGIDNWRVTVWRP